MSRLRHWWSTASRWQRVRTVLVAAAAVLAVVYQLLIANWYIEDAAISFAYARHLATGEGLVPWPGGERVEGYSNPLWVFLMAGFELVGVDGFWSSKILACVLAFVTIPVVWDLTRRIHAEATGTDGDDGVPVLAALLLASNPQFAIWNASGLENSLFCALLALGAQQTLREGARGGFAGSALAFLGLAITRPEGILYAAWGGLFGLVLQLRAGRGLRNTAGWLAVFWAPFLVYHAVRYQYFAWEFPNTYYAKVVEEKFDPWRWEFKGWRYLRRYAGEVGVGWLVPVVLLGATGAQGWRRFLWGLLTVAFAVCALYPGPESLGLPVPAWWSFGRTAGILGVGAVMLIASLRRPGWPGAALCAAALVSGLFFSLRSGGDWMDGFRWMSLVSVPLSILFALGIGELADAAQSSTSRRETWGWPALTVIAILLAAWAAPGAVTFDQFAAKPETGPFSVRKRVQYQHQVAERMFLDRRALTSLDVDMGGNMFWSGFQMVDAAGLVDVPVGHHLYQRPFVLEYVFTERRPELCHSHGGWFRKMKFGTMPEFNKTYLEIPGYPAGSKALHVGNHIRRDLLVEPAWHGSPDRAVTFDAGVTLEGWDLLAGGTAPGRAILLEIGLSGKQASAAADYRVLGFLARGDRVFTFDLAPGYDWYAPHEWWDGEVVFSRHAIPLPDDLEPGTWDLGFVVTNAAGVLAATQAEAQGAVGLPPAVSFGEVRFPAAVTVLSKDDHDDRVTATRRAVDDDAAGGRCESAEHGWDLLRWSRPLAYEWADEIRPGVARRLSQCWMARAQTAPDRDTAVDALARAWRWDARTPGLLAAGDPVADMLFDEGMAARDAADWETAYARFSDVLRVQATRSWARRYAEEARDFRLGIDPATVAAEEEERARRTEEAEARRKEILELKEAEQGMRPTLPSPSNP